MDSILLAQKPFSLYSLTHNLALLFFVLGAIVLVGIGRNFKNKRQERIFRRALVITSLSIATLLVTINLYNNGWDLQHSLPFHLCDTAYLLCHYALWTKRQWIYGILYYWGLTLTPQALITPFLPYDIPNVKALMFWGLHFFVIWTAIFMTWGLGMRPKWENLKQCCLATGGFMIAVFLFNTVFGTNYLYLNYKPANPSLLDWLGPWPIYPFIMTAIGMGLWVLITLPWKKKRVFWPLDDF